MEGLFNARIEEQAARKKAIRDAYSNNKNFAAGMLSGGGFRKVFGIKSPAEELATLQDDAVNAVTAEQGTPEYFQQLAKQLSDRGLRQSAMQAMAKSQEVARQKVTDDTNALALEKSQAEMAAKKRIAELSKQVTTPISTDPYKHYLELAELARNDGLYGEVKGLVELAKQARSSTGKDKGLAGYLGFNSDAVLKNFKPDSVQEASAAFLGGQSTPAEVLAMLEPKDPSANPGMSLKDFMESFKGQVDSLADPSAAHKLMAQYQTGDIDFNKFITEFSKLPIKSEMGEGLVTDIVEEWDKKLASATSELSNAKQMLAAVDPAITGTAQPVREFLAVGVSTFYELLGGTPPDWVSEATVATGQMKAALGRFILARIKTLGTNPSNADLNFLKDVLPGLGNSKDAIKKMTEYLVRRAQKNINMAKEMTAWSQKAEQAGFRGEIMSQRPDLLAAEQDASPEAIEEFFASLEDTADRPDPSQLTDDEIDKLLGGA